jgi:predicted metal-binding membrane protein
VSDTSLEAALRRDRTVVILALLATASLAWAYVLYLAAQMGVAMEVVPTTADDMSSMDMSGMNMSGMDMSAAVMPDFRPWAATDFAFIFVMWAIMMVAMMTPSVAPMVLLYAMVGRKARTDGKPFAASGWFFAGYAFVWVGFSFLATGAQWLLASASLLTPMMATADSTIGGLVLVVAGLYQWTPMKDVCVRQCQSPIEFLASRGGFRADPEGALSLGIQHGTYCLGCCWALMALLFVGGVMNIAWIGGIAVLILMEKILPYGRLVSRLSGVAIVLVGVWLLLTGL